MGKDILDTDLYLFNTGEAQRAYLLFGCHFIDEISMYRFCVWAPNARSVSLVGDFNGWDTQKTPMHPVKNGVFAAYVPDVKRGDNYKYHIIGYNGKGVLKADPFAFHAEVPPGTASKVWDVLGYEWGDRRHMESRVRQDMQKMPVSIYELHIGSWRKKDGYRFPSFREVARELADYCVKMGYTHVEVMPLMEHPYGGSWGYQTTGFFAVTSRYGTPQDFMYFVDVLHKSGIGVIMDWVGAHFPKDEHGLREFDGTSLFEHEDPRRGEHPEWGTVVFNYERPEVVSFLVSSAVFFMDTYHLDGLRVDAVTSMLYLDYARDAGNFVPNREGGNIDIDAVAFLKKLNSVVLTNYAGCMMIAEESTAYPAITKPPKDGGLGFTFKWNMGFMHDTLKFMSLDPLFRRQNHSKITFSMLYAFSENYILAYSHDEVVHGKKSMLDKMYGDYWQKFASLRALFGFMFAHPGKKLMFMGSEFGQFIEWAYEKELDWFLLKYKKHAGMQAFVAALNHIYKSHPSLYEIDDGWEGFDWLNVDDAENSVVAFMRHSAGGKKTHAVCAVNFTPVVRNGYAVAMPGPGTLKLLLNSDDKEFGGSGAAALSECRTIKDGYLGKPYRAYLALPPLAAVYYEFTDDE
jgi:1,4-alpha-glucan branching enzyme